MRADRLRILVRLFPLATLLAAAMLNALWALVMLRVAINVLSALLNLILRSPLARQLRSVQNDSELIYRRVVGVLRIGGIVLWAMYSG